MQNGPSQRLYANIGAAGQLEVLTWEVGCQAREKFLLRLKWKGEASISRSSMQLTYHQHVIDFPAAIEDSTGYPPDFHKFVSPVEA
jgi:hypothetical protein